MVGKKETPSSSSGAESNGEDSRRAIDLLLDPQLELDSPEVKFGRLLGGTDQRSRHNAVKMLREYLRARSDISSGMGLSELDLLKLWKGLWYTLYMADKTPVQDKLSKILAELMWCLAGTEEEDEYAGQMYCQMTDNDHGKQKIADIDGAGASSEEDDGDASQNVEMEDDSDNDMNGGNVEEQLSEEESALGNEEAEDGAQRIRDMNQKHCRGAHLVSLYIATFLRTVRREWGNVDKHRVDKFYTAVRFMVREAYKYMSQRHWNIGIVRLFNDVLYEEGLSADTPGLTNGLRYHLIDISVDELAKVSKDAELPLTEATFLDVLEPFFGLAQQAVDKHVQKRVMDNVLTKFLNEYSFVCPLALGEDDEAEEENPRSLIFKQVHVGTVSQFIFQVASDNNTDARFRKSLYEMHKAFVRQTREAGRDVDMDNYLGLGEGDAELNDEDEVAQDSEATMTEKDDQAETAEKGSPAHTHAKKGKSDVVPSAVTEDDQKPEKKKKRKKKRSKEEKEAAKVAANAAAEEADPNVATPNTKPLKRSKGEKEVAKAVDDTAADEGDANVATPNTKSTKRSKGDKEGTKVPENAAAGEGESNVATLNTKSSKKRKGEKEGAKAAENTAADEGAPKAATPKTKSSSKKKRKKQKKDTDQESPDPTTPAKEPRAKQQKSPPSVDPRAMHSPDQVVSPDHVAEAAMTASAFKRVSFGAMNHCKSHKASMKAVKTLDKKRWDTQSRTPEKGILRPLGSKSSEKKTRSPSGSSSRKKSKKRGRKQT